MNNKKLIDSELIDITFKFLNSAPDSQIDEATRKEIVNFDMNSSYGEKYDFLVSISEKPLTSVSSFIVELCALDTHYLKPVK